MRRRINFDEKFFKAIVFGKKRATIRIGRREYAKKVRLYCGKKFLGEALVKKVRHIKLDEIDEEIERKEGMSKREITRYLEKVYGGKGDIFTYVEFELEKPVFVGIDLAANPKNKSGVVAIDINGKIIFAKELKTNSEIISKVNQLKPLVVAIDAPLSLTRKPWREAEKELLKLGYKPLPLTMPSMIMLAKRAIKLAKKLKGEVIETFAPALRHRKKFKSEHLNDAYACALLARDYFLGNYKNVAGIILPGG